MRFSIAWHEDCLKNSKAALERDREAMERAKVRFESASRRVFHYERQIAEAKKRGIDSFDSERFLKSRDGDKSDAT